MGMRLETCGQNLGNWRLECSKKQIFNSPSLPLLSIQKENSGMNKVCQGKDNMVVVKEQEIAALRKQLDAKDQQLSAQESSLSSLQQRCSSLQSELDTAQRRILSLEVRAGM